MDYLLALLRDFIPLGGTTQLIFLLVVGGAVFALALAILFLLTTLTDPLQSRLKKLAGADPKKKPWLASASQALRPLTQYVEPQQSPEESRLKHNLVQAGYRQANALGMFYALKMIMMAIFPIAALFGMMVYAKLTPQEIGYFMLAAAGIGFMLPNILLKRAMKSRQKRIRDGFPDALDLLVVCTEAGLSLKSAIQRVGDEMSISHEELALELSTVNAEMRAGMESITALKNLVERTGLSEIRGLVVMLSQSMRFGTSVGETLRIYADEFRDKRMQRAEEQAAKLSIKLLFPLTLCFLPAFLIVGVGPAILGAIAAFR